MLILFIKNLNKVTNPAAQVNHQWPQTQRYSCHHERQKKLTYYRIQLLKNNAILALFLKKEEDEFTRMKENDTAHLLEHNEFSTQTEVTTVCSNGVPFEKNIYSMNHYN